MQKELRLKLSVSDSRFPANACRAVGGIARNSEGGLQRLRAQKERRMPGWVQVRVGAGASR
eukprot:1259395-Pleurochrysis_carterae.AAC.1